MDDLKALYFQIENPIDNKEKWNKLLNIYSTSSDFDDFLFKVNERRNDNSFHYDIEDKNTFLLMVWSIFKRLLLSFSLDDLNSFIEMKRFETDVFDAVRIIRNLESVKSINVLNEVLSNPEVNRYFSRLFNEFNHDIIIYSSLEHKDGSYNTVLTVNVESVNLYKFLKSFVNECINNEIPYYIKYNEKGENIVVNIYSEIEHVKKTESILDILVKENYAFFKENSNSLLTGNIDQWISIKNKDYFNDKDYFYNRSLIIFKSFDSVLYEYVVNHLNTLISYKGGRMNLIDYLSNYVMERVIANLLSVNIKSSNEYFRIANSKDLINLKDYIKSKLSFSMKDILAKKLYLKNSNEKIDFRLNSNKNIGIEVNIFMCAIRNLILTLMYKDNSIEKLFKVRIKNECQFYNVDPGKFCLDISFSKKLFFDSSGYDEYQKELSIIQSEIAKFDDLEKLLGLEPSDDTRTKIASSMNDLFNMFDD